jgi:hypothetical protein
MSDDFKTSTDTSAPSEATGGRSNLDTAKIQASMQGSAEQPADVQPNNQETPENIDQADKDRAEMEAALQGAREQQERDRLEMHKDARLIDEQMLAYKQQRLRDIVNGKVPVASEGVTDPDVAQFQAFRQEQREQQDRELQEDLAKFENRPKPPYYQDSSGVDEGVHWEDRGVIDVPVADLPQPEDVNGPQDFDHNISYQDAVRANEQLLAMKPLIDSGYTKDDFADLDRKNGLDYDNGQQRIYELYYGDKRISLYKDGNHYDIESGRHRIYIAQERGNDFIPANVKEKVSK